MCSRECGRQKAQAIGPTLFIGRRDWLCQALKKFQSSPSSCSTHRSFRDTLYPHHFNAQEHRAPSGKSHTKFVFLKLQLQISRLTVRDSFRIFINPNENSETRSNGFHSQVRLSTHWLLWRGKTLPEMRSIEQCFARWRLFVFLLSPNGLSFKYP
jgi:hypothetical protein